MIDIGGWNNWVEHPTWTLELWREDVATDETRSGYGEWVMRMSRLAAGDPNDLLQSDSHSS
ncbi:hypothetical protein SEA_NEDARYA_38 [Gordonia phage Nedarya]|nr:hypothetical protein SEA_NEDARYA_38 [Gordonia phage Nedarya]